MTYLIAPVSATFTSASPAAGTSVSAGALSTDPYALNVLIVGGLGVLATGVSQATGGGTWTRIASIVNGGVSTEIWVGYNYSGAVGSSVAALVAFAASTKPSLEALQISTSSTVTSITAGTPATATGTSTAPDPGTVTPAVGDIVIAAATWANVTASSARTDTPGGADQFQTLTTTAATASRVEGAARLNVRTTTATKRVWTITSAVWAAANVAFTLPTVSEAAALVIKGTDTAAADAASSY